MSNDTPTSETSSGPTPFSSSPSDSLSKTQSAIQSLSSILPSIPSSISSAFSLLHDPEIASQISSLLRQPNSGAGDNNLCRWLYDTFQSGDPELQLVVLRFLPIVAGVYLSRVTLRKPLAGFEAVLLALYAHETTSRAGQPITVNIPDMSHPSIYHDPEAPKNNATELNLAVLSPTLEPHGALTSSKRAEIVGATLQLYYSKIFYMPVGSKIDFCDICVVWSGHDGDMSGNGGRERMGKEGMIRLPWELLTPVLRIVGHCLMGTRGNEELFDAAWAACRCLYARSVHDINPRAILATGSLLRLRKINMEAKEEFDTTEIRMSKVLTL